MRRIYQFYADVLTQRMFGLAHLSVGDEQKPQKPVY